MMFIATVFALFFAALSVLAAPSATATVSYDETYDNANGDLNTVACSDGPKGLVTKGFPTFGSLPRFPYIGGAAAIAGWGSEDCGSCWTLSYNGRSINVLAVDHTDAGFNIALEAMNDLTNGQAQFLGRIDATFEKVDSSVCGL